MVAVEYFQDKNNLQRKQSETTGRAIGPEQISACFSQKAKWTGNLWTEEEEGAELMAAAAAPQPPAPPCLTPQQLIAPLPEVGLSWACFPFLPRQVILLP